MSCGTPSVRCFGPLVVSGTELGTVVVVPMVLASRKVDALEIRPAFDSFSVRRSARLSGKTVRERRVMINGRYPERSERISGLGGRVDERGNVGFQFRQVFVADVHHVAGIVVLQFDVATEIWCQAEMIHGLLGRKEWRR